MSAWRRVAHERFPDLKNEIDRAASPDELWKTLKREFDRAYLQEDVPLIKAVHEFGWWMIDSTHSAEMANAVVDGFYRPLVETNWVADDWEVRRPALELSQYLGDERLTSLYWDFIHDIVPAWRQREFIAELGVGKPVRREVK
ncbi:MAG: hypothetical protein NVS9B15_04880 [Acidobacteriaceae bacterium]